MRISDWSSDVCSSDLAGHALPDASCPGGQRSARTLRRPRALRYDLQRRPRHPHPTPRIRPLTRLLMLCALAAFSIAQAMAVSFANRQSVVSGKGVPVGVDLGGRRLITTNIKEPP